MTVAGMIDERSLRELAVDAEVFDANWYLERYPDVAMSGLDPWEHYLRYGRPLARCPGPGFDPAWYAARNPDAVASGIDLFTHYVRFGRSEGRSGADPGAAPSALSDASPLVREARLLGYIDRVRSTSIEGWAIDEGQPGQSVPLHLFVDGEKVLDFSTANRRSDLCARNMPGEHAGFTVHVPRGVLRNGQVVEVQDSRGRQLKGSPNKVEGVLSRGPLPSPTYLTALSSRSIRPVSVVVPVFNSPGAVACCLASLRRCPLPDGAEVVMLDDGSTDPEIAPLLERYAREPGFRLEENPANIGYTRTVNRALELCGSRDVVLLNSDTEVSPRWLHNLRYCAYSQPDIGTVTALSDNAGAFSVPDLGVANPLPAGLPPGAAAQAVVQAGEGRPIDVPTGNGFCIYLRRDAIDEIGGFDEAKYPSGYGEENDLCMRLMYAGWRNVICDKAYVTHLRTQSFGDRKNALVRQGAQVLSADYPEYRSLTARFRDLEFGLLRGRVRKALRQAISQRPRPRILYVISTATGGTPQTNLDLMKAVSRRYDCFLLRSDSMELTLSRLVDGRLIEVEKIRLSHPITPVPHTSAEYDRFVADMMYRHSIDMLHVRHVAWHGLGLAAAAKALQIPVVFSVHDFYSLCPSVNLMSDQSRYCGPGEQGARISPLWPSHAAPDGFVPRWRRMMRGFLEGCDAFVTTAPSAAALFSEVYPEHGERLRVIPHGRDFPELAMSAQLPVPGRPLRVLVPGNISAGKGAKLLAEIAALDEAGTVELHFLGNVSQDVRGVGIQHGPYKREEFPAKVRQIAPHVGVVLSIWPETFCHTLTEMWACGVPVLGLEIGAVGDRIRTTGGGWLLPPDATAADVLERLRSLRDAAEEVAARQVNIVRWQQGDAVVQDTAHMAARYRRLYRELLHAGEDGLVVAGMVMKPRGHGDYSPTSHIRLLRPLEDAAGTGRVDARPITVEALVAGAAAAFDVVVIQRDAVPPHQKESLIGALSKAGIPWVFEIDDKLWMLPDDHRDHDIDEAKKEAMLAFARGAACITTSTEALGVELRNFNSRVEVVPNAPDERLWCPPLDGNFRAQVANELGIDPERRYILYMGSNSHARDLELIAPAIDRVIARHADVQVLQIGGGYPLPYAIDAACPQKYASYPAFVTWFRAVCSHCTLALAPLRENDFNLAKSDIKWLDYALGGVPAVLSRFGPYPDSVEDGVTGILCGPSVDAWEQGIESLLASPDSREKIRNAAWEAAMARTLGSSGVSGRWNELLGVVGVHGYPTPSG